MKFEELNLDPRLLTQVKRMGYSETTPIQSRSIPEIMLGSDILGQAQTGTGKTAAFALPLLHRLLKLPRGTIRALVIAPTRELAEQIHNSFIEYGRGTSIRSVTVYGGVSMGPQKSNLRSRPDIVVACPGRLLDHMRNGTIDLSRIDTLILDEADRMLDMGFLRDIRSILKELPRKRQTMLFSATLTKDIRHLATDFMNRPVSIDIGHSAPLETVSHAIYPVDQHLKGKLLIELLKKTDARSVIVFTRTKHRARRLDKQLNDVGFKAVSLQGNLSQNRRQAALDGFRSGKFQILVATDIAARGIDVSTISHVINFDMPDTVDAYTHRIGRTGRVDRTGDAFTLTTRDDRVMIKTIEKMMGYNLEQRTMEGFNYYAPPPKRNNDQNRPRQYQGSSNRKPRQFTRSPSRSTSRKGMKPSSGAKTMYRSVHR
jgi:ATP-dependent RNA helicase RhlE